MESPPDVHLRTPASPRLATFLRGILAGSRIVAARLRFLAVFVLVFAIIGGWETLRSYTARLISTAAPESGISADSEYFCPMDPGVISDWPSKCPVCNMSLVLRKRGDAAPLPEGVMARMQLTPYRLWLGGVATTPVEYRPLARAFELPGVLVGMPPAALRIEAEAFAHELRWIEPGQPAEVILPQEEDSHPLHGKVRDVPRMVADLASVPRITIELETPPDHLRPGDPVLVRIRCPVEKLEPFRSLPSTPPPVSAGEPRRLYYCMNHPDVLRESPGACPKDRLELMARSLRENQRVRWWCPMHPSVTADRAGSKCDDCGGMILVPRVISYRLPGTVLSVPSSAVIDDGAKSLVYADTGQGMFDAKIVKLGPRCGDSFPVLAGLEPDDRIVTQGAFLLDAETRLNPSLAAGYFGAGNAASTSRDAASNPAVDSTPDWLKGLSLADRSRALLQKTCPVTGKPLGSMGVPGRVEVKGIAVFVCCEGCSPAIESNLEKYLAKIPPKDQAAEKNR
ncbi:MAG: hypothetical protein ABS79_07605 [Planctomycetes bacterium SCN 63-9]|nr:MAG: hypothetical protein ABS79_07605 [Planctomycetes bacterium SCN 63-9]